MDNIRERVSIATLQADLFGSSSQPAQIVELQLVGERLVVRGQGFCQQVPVRQIRWPHAGDSSSSSSLLELPDGALLHCRPDPLLTQWSESVRAGRQPRRGQMRNVGLALAAALLVWAGLPVAAESMLPQVPHQIDRHIGQRLLDRLDALWLQPSDLPAQTQQNWRQRLTDAVAQACPDARLPAWNLQFRHGRGDDRNAGAIGLPGGTVVLLDDQLGSGTLNAVCRELGQLQQRQGMRTLARQQPVSLLMGVAFDDFSSTVAVAWPVLAQHLPFIGPTSAGAGPGGQRIARR
ncbi:hypothetical protein [Sphaerotilus sp.]|uniref:DUF7092 domain-containing protein n=1 Tax=Sphaerotilus sp. TaxID=2093942 RepID=UPI00286E2E9B|nr:hypothetical protein [Sphaerotilus sp.]